MFDLDMLVRIPGSFHQNTIADTGFSQPFLFMYTSSKMVRAMSQGTLAYEISIYALARALKRSRGAHFLPMRPVYFHHMQVPALVSFCDTGGLLPSWVKLHKFMNILLAWHRG